MGKNVQIKQKGKKTLKKLYNCGQDLCTVDVMPPSAALHCTAPRVFYTINK